jgi:PAS domain-containing protein
MDEKEELLVRIAKLETENRDLRRTLANVRKAIAKDRAHPVMLARALVEGSPHERIAQLETLFEQLPVGIAIAFGADSHEIWANAVLQDLLGRAGTQHIPESGPQHAEVLFHVYREGVETPPSELPMQRSAREGIPIVGSRYEIHRDDGRVVVLQGIVRPLLGRDGSRRGSVGAFFDVTKRETEVSRLQTALSQVRVLTGFIRICASCKRIGDDADIWQPLERYITDHSDAKFTHGLCPDCFARAMHELANFPKAPEEL